MYTYKMTFRHHIQNFWPLLIYIIGLSLLPLYMINGFGKADLLIYFNISLGLLAVVFIPQIIIHLNYFFSNKGDKFIYDAEQMKITIEHDKVFYSFNFDDIKRIERYMSYSLSENRMQFLPWDGYNHSLVYLKNGQSFVITSLLVPNLDLPINEEKIKIRKGLYRLARKK